MEEGASGVVVNPLTSHLLGLQFEPWPQPYVGKLVVAYRCQAVYSAKSLPTSIY